LDLAKKVCAVKENALESERINADSSYIEERVRGAVFAAVCGNSLGGSCLGLNFKEILTTVGVSRLRDFAEGHSKSTLPNHKPGELLSDSYLSLSLAESLIETKGRFKPEVLQTRYKELLGDARFSDAGPGAPCLAALRHLVDGKEPYADGPESSHPSGSIRAFVAGLLPGGAKSDEPVDVATRQIKLAQSDGRSIAAAAVIADSVNFFVKGGGMKTADDVRTFVKREFELASRFDPRFAEWWDDVAPDLDYANPAEELPYSLINVEANVNELVPTAVGIFLIFRHSLEEAVCAAARCGGDTAAVACLVGALSGAYHGYANVPKRWLDAIDQRERLNAAADGLIKLWA